MEQVDRNQSLEELEQDKWGEPTYPSHLVRECHKLRRIPLRQFSIENLRIMIGQNIGLKYLVPLAIERLRENPLAEGDFYPGDLLVNVLKVDTDFWRDKPEIRKAASTIAEQAIRQSSSRQDIGDDVGSEAVATAYERFRRTEY